MKNPNALCRVFINNKGENDMKRAIATVLLITMLIGLPAMTLAEGNTPTPINDGVFTATNELTAAWGSQYPADVGGLAVNKAQDRLIVLLVNNTAARQIEIRRLVSVPSALLFYDCKYSYADMSAVQKQIGQRMVSEGEQSGVSGVGIGYCSDGSRTSGGFGASGYEMRVIVHVYTKAAYDRLRKEMAVLYGDIVYVDIVTGINVPMTDGEAETPVASETWIATDSVNVRSGPDTNYKKLGRLKRGNAVEVLDITGKWARIVWKDSEGYVYAKYLRMAQTAETDPTAAGAWTAVGTVNVRSGPDTDYKKLGRIKRGDTVQVLDFSGKWARIVWDGAEGYVYAKYLNKDG